jgi:uncharacterized membrane protein YdbT with pleckstrin-like domain
MGISPKLLGDGEHIVLSTRTHIKALVVPAILLVVIFAADGFLIALVDQKWARIAIIALAAVIIIWGVLVPFLNWLTASYTITNRRLVARSGLITRRGRDIPLYRINDVKYERGLLDRLLGCGTLVISDASEEGHQTLHDIPNVEEVHLQITDLLFGNNDGADDDGTPPVGRQPRPR